MPRRRCLECRALLPEASPAGGRPQLYCSARCRGRHRRFMRRYALAADRRDDRLEATDEERHRLRATVFAVAREARRLAAELEAEAQQPVWRQPAWSERAYPEFGLPGAPYTRAALEILDAAEQALAQAVTADRAAGHTWETIGAALGVSSDTAARRYRRPAPRPPAPQ
ncbi:hypothetical protein [Streptomyces gilvosporeus]|uniref:hypothetical protein n=1 Tax=Streptomyces gilvosporeus TaxID=553510 RepID=UPI0033E6411C